MTRKRHIAQEALYWLLIIALLTAGGFLLFTNLDVPVIDECDEARHGINAYEMMQSGDYIVHTYNGETDYWNLKPPLSYWCIMAGYRLFGFNALGLRFYSALSMLLTMIIMALWTKKRLGSVASIVCQLFWLGCAMVYGKHFARFGDADAQMLLFYVIAMLCMLQSPKNIRWLYGSAVCFGLAYMSKSWHAALIPVTCLAFVCVTGQIKKMKLHHYLLLIFFGLLPIAPWAVARIMRDGLTFFTTSITVDVGLRATTVHETHVGGPLYYVEHLLNDPAVVVALIACAVALVLALVARKRMRAIHWGLLLWFAVPLVSFSLCTSKLAWYIFVSLPPLAIALGMACRQLAAGAKLRPVRIAAVLAACGVLVWLGVGNWTMVCSLEKTDSYHVIIEESLDRDWDSGTKVYIQYESVNSYYPVDYRSWIQDHQLAAMLKGDVICVNGGIEAFLAEEEHAYLICHEIGMDWSLLEQYPIVMEDGSLMLLDNLM